MFNTTGNRQHYRIKSVATITGLSTHVIRKWEERYNLLQPHRSPNGYRTFSENDIQFLLFLKNQLAHGGAIGQLAQTDPIRLREAMHQIPLNLSYISPTYQQDARDLVQAARSQDVDRIKHKLETWIAHMGFQKASEEIIFPLLRLIGDLWHQGGISISGEHSVSQLIRQHLLTAIRHEPSRGHARAVVACVPGNYHEIGPLTTTLVLQQLGWDSTYLGPNVSFDVLRMALRRKKTQLMILSSMLQPTEHSVRSWIQNITRHIQPTCLVVVGGPGFLAYANLLNQHRIPYVQTIQGLAQFTPNRHLERRSDMGFIHSQSR